MRLDDRERVSREYATEDRFLARRLGSWAELDGPNVEDEALAAVREDHPRRVLDAGCGPGEFAQRLERELSLEVVALDLSPRMAELARQRGLDAGVADLQALPFPGGAFDCVVANRVLYHVPDPPTASSTFTSENGAASLRGLFARVERRDVAGRALFPDRAAICGYLAAYEALVDADWVTRLPHIATPFVATYRHSAFVAVKAS